MLFTEGTVIACFADVVVEQKLVPLEVEFAGISPGVQKTMVILNS